MGTRKHLIFVAVTAAALVLAGCGSSGPKLAVDEKDPKSAGDAEAQLAAVKAAYNAADAALTKLKTDPSDATQAEVDDADAKLEALKEALKAATAVSDEDKARYAAAAIETALAAAKEAATPAIEARVAVDMSGIDENARVTAGVLNIPAGESRKLGDVTYSCPADGEACVVTVRDDRTAIYAGGMPTAMHTPGFQVSKLLLDVGTIETETREAKKTADDKLAEAKEKTKLDALSVLGESETAVARAQAILDAEAAIEAALQKAKGAQTKAGDAKTAAEALPTDAPNREAMLARTAAALTEADKVVKAIEKIQTEQGTGTLRQLVAQIKGDDGMGTAAKAGFPAAMQIDAALKRATAAASSLQIGNALRMVHAQDRRYPDPVLGSGVDTDDAFTKPVEKDNAPSGTKSVSEVVDLTYHTKAPRYFFDADGVDAGKPTGVEDCGGCGSLNIGKVGAAGTPYADQPLLINDPDGFAATYKGFKGFLKCEGTLHNTCRIEGPGGNQPRVGTLRGSFIWMTNQPYDKQKWSETKQLYEPVAYAKYGYWLSSNRSRDRLSTGNQITVHTFAYTVEPNTVAYINGPDVASAASATLAATGTYKGHAIGMSVLKEGSGASASVKSGQFEADVTLNATFGASAALEGTVDNFRGKAADSSWSVALQSSTDSDMTFPINESTSPTTRVGTDGETGRWSALAYGEENKRPMGITGAFNAYFTNGAAAGAYATTLQTE